MTFSAKIFPQVRRLLALSILLSLAGCMRGNTTTRVPSQAIEASDDKATLVFLRPWISTQDEGEAVPGNVPYGYQQDYVRILDEDETPMADLRFNQYSVVQVAPGSHTFFAYNWADSYGVPTACIGALRADLAPGRVYPVVVRDYRNIKYGAAHHSKGRGSHRKKCKELELMRGAELDDFWTTMWRSERRELSSKRETSPFVDGQWVVDSVMKGGRQRAGHGDGPSTTSGLSENNSLTRRDGVPDVPNVPNGASLLGDEPRPPVLPVVAFRGGLPYTNDDALVAAGDSSLGFAVGVLVGVSIFDRLQLLLSMDLGSPGVADNVENAYAVSGNYSSNMFALGAETRLVSPEILGFEWMGGFALRKKWLGVDYRNPDSTAPLLKKRRGKRPPDTSLGFTGVGYGPVVGARRTIFGIPGKSQLAFVLTLQPEWTSWRATTASVRRDDIEAQAVGTVFENMKAPGSSFTWNMSAGLELAF